MLAPGGPDARAVTLPMADVLAEAPEVSPWWGLEPEEWEALAGVPVRSLDELNGEDRMMLMVGMPRCTARQLRVLVATARHGWCARWSFGGLREATGLPDSSLSEALADIEAKGLARVNRIFYGEGSRFFLVTISGDAIARSYRRTTGAALPNLGSATDPNGDITGVALPKLGSAHRPTAPYGGRRTSPADSPISATGDAGSVRPTAPLPGSSALPKLGSAALARDARASRAPTVGQSVSSHELSSDDLDLTDGQTNRARAREAAISGPELEAPGWWPDFVRLHRRLRSPQPRPPSWGEIAAFVHPEDPGLDILREACAQYLEQYSQPKAQPVRRPRGAIRAIYGGLVEWALSHSQGVEYWLANVAWASDVWLSGEPEERPGSKYRADYERYRGRSSDPRRRG